MKTNKKIRVFAIMTAIIVMLFSITASAAEKLDQNMHGGDLSFSERFEYSLQGTVTGMLMVFAVLGLLFAIVSLSKVIFYDMPNNEDYILAKDFTHVEGNTYSLAIVYSLFIDIFSLSYLSYI